MHAIGGETGGRGTDGSSVRKSEPDAHASRVGGRSKIAREVRMRVETGCYAK